MCLVKLPDELNIFSQYLHLKGFLSTACVLFSFFFLFFFSFFFFWGGGGAAQGGDLNPLNPPVDPRLGPKGPCLPGCCPPPPPNQKNKREGRKGKEKGKREDTGELKGGRGLGGNQI